MQQHVPHTKVCNQKGIEMTGGQPIDFGTLFESPTLINFSIGNREIKLNDVRC